MLTSTRREGCVGLICAGMAIFSNDCWCTVAACNLGLWMRTLTGIGTPRGLQGRLAAVWAFCFTLWVLLRDQVTAHRCRGLNLRLFAIPSHHFALIPCVL
jgi:hypothetical protein